MNFRNCKKNFNKVLKEVGIDTMECFMDKGYLGWAASYVAVECNGLRSFEKVIRVGGGGKIKEKEAAQELVDFLGIILDFNTT